ASRLIVNSRNRHSLFTQKEGNCQGWSRQPIGRKSRVWRSRMFWRMFGGQAVLLLAAIGLLGVVVVRSVEDRDLRETQEGLQARAHMIAELVRDRPVADVVRLQERLAAQHEQLGARITLLADDGRVLADTEHDPALMENHAGRPEVQAAR